ncbi:hypothetical protein [Streptomyces rubrogriseus]|uniref:hypothetical protein n=1 Tax=Streptomyces rubrogriseus TaxID=194673 RepID=UPI00367CB43D
MSADNERAARHLAAQVGITDVHSPLRGARPRPLSPRRSLRASPTRRAGRCGRCPLADFLHAADRERTALSEHRDHGDRTDAFTFAAFAECHVEVLGRYLRLARHDHDTGRTPIWPPGNDAR